MYLPAVRRAYTPHLQPELWLRIFRFATISSSAFEASENQYVPFGTVLWKPYDCFALKAVIRTKRTLVLVCKYWWQIAVEFLYEDVQICRGTTALKEVLEHSTGHSGKAYHGYGRWVRRVELFSTLTDFNPFNPTTVVDILRSCPRMELLVRRYCPSGGDPLLSVSGQRLKDTFPVLLSLKRLDWWFPPGSTTSEGLGFLGDLLRHAPKLEYLSLGHHRSTHQKRNLPPTKINLPALTVLRLEDVDSVLVSSICGWQLPNLSHIIADPTFFSSQNGLLRLHGCKIRIIELMQHDSFLDKEYLHPILLSCPDLEELNYHVECTLAASFCSLAQISPHPVLRVIRLHLTPSSRMKYSGTTWRMLGDASLWDHLALHFTMLLSCTLPNSKIILHGDWTPFWEDWRFHALHGKMLQYGYIIELAKQ